MKKISLSILLASVFLFSCSKEDDPKISKQEKNNDCLAWQAAAGTGTSPKHIPAEILQLMHADLVKEGKQAKADKLKDEYSFSTGERNKISAKTGKYVAGVGSVMEGAWGNTQESVWGHIQNTGWVDYGAFGFMQYNEAYDTAIPGPYTYIGTTGRGLKLEAFYLPYIAFIAAPITSTSAYSSSVFFQYRAYVSGIGWQPYVSSLQTAGTTGQGLSMQSVEIKPYPGRADYVTFNNGCTCMYAVKTYYRVHVAGSGWLPWTGNGSPAGTAGSGRQIEALQIVAYVMN